MLSAQSGPLVLYGSRTSDVAEAPGGNNPDYAPSLVLGDMSLIDMRVGYNVTRAGAIGLGVGYRRIMTATPSTKATANIAALANVVTGTAMTKVTVTGAGVTVLAAALQVWASGNSIPATSLALDGAPGLISFGQASPSTGNTKISMYDNTKNVARAVSITGVVSTTGGDFIVRGADIYGYPMSETITAAAGVATTNGKKAFKFIYSITPQFTDAHTYSVGTTDIFGFSVRYPTFPDGLIWWNNALITANTGYVVPDATTPSATTGDVRGTYAVQSASDGTKQLIVAVGPGMSTMTTAAGLFGQTQFSV